ncbi:MAG: hypothetical protein A3E83_01570 [Gammaproteobacteria bacterium RIFCSPHIGHO2_12_FULL_41_20]|nr:MAG: hypothetical protein A3E83_01570 [Gammaproteobacteria bacterium RIFCSPHIGHO2_12_FULL_41_20]
MRLAYATTFNSQDVKKWSGTPYYMSQAFSQQNMEVSHISSLKRKLPPFFKLKQVCKKYLTGERDSPRFNTVAAAYYSKQVQQHLVDLTADIILAPQINPIAYLDCKQPIVLWTDSLYAALLGFYHAFAYHSPSSVKQGNSITLECLSRCRLAIFSSDWAAQSALQFYGTQREKVKVVPFGANIKHAPSFTEIRDIVKHRQQGIIKLLFLGKDWYRKGGDKVLAVAEALRQAGQAVELTLVGCYPPKNIAIPAYVKCLGFISKRTPEGERKISQLLRDSHFLFVPSRAEAYGIVFCEANAWGIPCLTTYVGGISTIVKDNLNGMTFSLDASAKEYCDYIINLMQHRIRYEEMALAAFNEYETRLNWQVATKTVKKLMKEVI